MNYLLGLFVIAALASITNCDGPVSYINVISQSTASIVYANYIGNNSHTVARKCHGAGRLILDQTLANISYQWTIRMGHNNRLSDMPNPDPRIGLFGQNSAFICSITVANNASWLLHTATMLWYNEVSIYNYSNPGYSTATSHFTQMVWAATTRVGFGITLTNNVMSDNSIQQCAWIHAIYQVEGNIGNEYTQNVKPATCTPNWSKVTQNPNIWL